MEALLPLLVVLIIVAALLREDAVLAVLYLLLGIYLLQRFASRSAFRHVDVHRVFDQRAFYDQVIPVELNLVNRSWLPVVWLKVHESLPIELASPNFVQSVVTLAPRGHEQVRYKILARKRGYYALGPVQLESGDLLGLVRESTRQAPEDYLIVYPRIYPLEGFRLVSQSPFGTIVGYRPLFEDPARVRGKRDYASGDSLRRVDWKATAVAGRLQVKNYEPSISLVACVVLNLHPGDYEQSRQFSSAELAVICAASLANRVSRHKQAVGLSTNGIDPMNEDRIPRPLPPRTGAGGLMQILDVLARIQPHGQMDCQALLRQTASGLTWGSTILLVTSLINTSLLEELLLLRTRGLNVMITAVGPLPNQRDLHRIARQSGFPISSIEFESDLEVWQTPR